MVNSEAILTYDSDTREIVGGMLHSCVMLFGYIMYGTFLKFNLQFTILSLFFSSPYLKQYIWQIY